MRDTNRIDKVQLIDLCSHPRIILVSFAISLIRSRTSKWARAAALWPLNGHLLSLEGSRGSSRLVIPEGLHFLISQLVISINLCPFYYIHVPNNLRNVILYSIIHSFLLKLNSRSSLYTHEYLYLLQVICSSDKIKFYVLPFCFVKKTGSYLHVC